MDLELKQNVIEILSFMTTFDCILKINIWYGKGLFISMKMTFILFREHFLYKWKENDEKIKSKI